MAFVLDNLAAHAPRETVSAGIRLYTNGRVQIEGHIPGLVTANVKDDNNRIYDTVIRYGREMSDITAVLCNCPQFTQDENIVYCRHIVATALKCGRVLSNESDPKAERMKARWIDGDRSLLRFVPDIAMPDMPNQADTAIRIANRTDSVPDRKRVPVAYGPKPSSSTTSAALPYTRKTDYLAGRLLKDSAARSFKLNGPGFDEKAYRLEALLETSPNNSLALRFRIGHVVGNHMYIIKNLDDFVEGFRIGAFHTLGTKRRVLLCKDSFDSDSQPLIYFLQERYDPLSNGFPGRAKDRRNMVLNQGEVDALLSIGANLYMRNRGSSEIREVSVKDEDHRLHIRIEKASEDQNDGLIIRTVDSYELIEGVRRVYTVADGVVYAFSEVCSDACRGLLKTLAASKGSMYFSGADIPSLFTNIIKRAEPFLALEMSDDVGKLAPPELETKVYFDMDEAGYVTARMTFSYGDITHDAFEDPRRLDVSLDPAGEAYAENILRRYIGHVVSGPGTLIVLDNTAKEERLYTLATEGLDRIREFAEVFASESFDTLKARPPMNISVGVKVDGRLLTLNINADGVDFSELAEILRSYRLAKKYHRLRDGSFIALEGDALEELSDLAEGLDLDPGVFSANKGGHGQSSITLDLNRAMYIDAMMRKNESVRYDRDKSFRGLVRNFSDVANADYQPPERLIGTLRNYQETGYRWLRTLDALGFGGILADDMGLGKTLQALTLFSAAKTEDPQEDRLPSIVVCPSSIMFNWESEAKTFTPDLSVSVVFGSADDRKKIIERAKPGAPGKNAAGIPDLFVTSYDLLKRDIEAYDGIEFRFVVIDEAQYIKNQLTQNAKSVKLLNGRTRLALTGTPIENTLAELWSIFDFLMPGYLFRYSHFKRRFETPIVKQTDKKAENRLKEMVRPFVLRRLKRDVLKELPEKIETVLKSEMDDEQRKLYIANLARTKKELATKLTAAGAPRAKFEILAALMRLRRLCCDPALVYEDYTGGSAKLDACMELVESCIESGHRILLFSQFTSMLDRIEKRFSDAKIDWYRLDGSTPTTERHSLMNNFNSGDVPVFLISLKAGGTGLNLTGADIVIHYDPWWNISVQNQATDRAHRIGQTERVQVFKLIAKDTIEERIMEMQERKADLADRIIREGGDAFETLTEEELLALFE